MEKSKQEFWKTLTEPVHKDCMNCSHWIKMPKGHNVCDIAKFNECSIRYIDGKDYWEYRR